MKGSWQLPEETEARSSQLSPRWWVGGHGAALVDKVSPQEGVWVDKGAAELKLRIFHLASV